MTRPFLTFVHISDTHIGPAADFTYHDRQPLADLERLVAHLNEFPQPPDFIIHTGDVANDQGVASYNHAAPVLAGLNVPIYYVNGNHDNPALLRQKLGAPAHPGGDPAAPLDYTFTVKDERFLVLDAHHADLARDPLGVLTEHQLEFARAEATPDGPPLTVLMHFPPFRMGSPWLDDNMILTNGADLHAALLPARDRLRGVFFGHLHRSCQIVRDGIRYTGAPSAAWQYAWRPWDETPQVDLDLPPAYNVVQYFREQVIVLQYAVPAT